MPEAGFSGGAGLWTGRKPARSIGGKAQGMGGAEGMRTRGGGFMRLYRGRNWVEWDRERWDL